MRIRNLKLQINRSILDLIDFKAILPSIILTTAKPIFAIQSTLAIVLVGIICVSSAYANNSISVCDKIYSSADMGIEIAKHNANRWLHWEQKYNVSEYRRASSNTYLKSTTVDSNKIESIFLTPESQHDLQSFVFTSEKKNIWYRHPTNTTKRTEHDNSTFSVLNTDMMTTASRSLVFSRNKSLYSIKLGTDHPHDSDYTVPNKASVKEDLYLGKSRSAYAIDTESKFGTDPYIVLAKEVAIITDKQTREGYSVRDISFILNKDRLYLPAFSIPYLARYICDTNEMSDVFTFWKNHYAHALGRAKAKLLLHYGLQMDTPNPQNILIELDNQYRPTGRIVFRDIGDMSFVRPVAFAYGARKLLAEDLRYGIKNTDQILPNNDLSFLFFDRKDKDQTMTLTKSEMQIMIAEHNMAYIQTLATSLNINLSTNQYSQALAIIQRYLTSPEGIEALKKYRQIYQK